MLRDKYALTIYTQQNVQSGAESYNNNNRCYRILVIMCWQVKCSIHDAWINGSRASSKITEHTNGRPTHHANKQSFYSISFRPMMQRSVFDMCVCMCVWGGGCITQQMCCARDLYTRPAVANVPCRPLPPGFSARLIDRVSLSLCLSVPTTPTAGLYSLSGCRDLSLSLYDDSLWGYHDNNPS